MRVPSRNGRGIYPIASEEAEMTEEVEVPGVTFHKMPKALDALLIVDDRNDKEVI